MREVLISFIFALVIGSAINGYANQQSQPTSQPDQSESTASPGQIAQNPAQPSRVADTSQATFQQDVLTAAQPVLVDFYATWCGPCKIMKPTIEQIANQYDGKAKVVRVDVDANPELAAKYKIRVLPTFILFKNGQPVFTAKGFTPKEKFISTLDQYAQ